MGTRDDRRRRGCSKDDMSDDGNYDTAQNRLEAAQVGVGDESTEQWREIVPERVETETVLVHC